MRSRDPVAPAAFALREWRTSPFLGDLGSIVTLGRLMPDLQRVIGSSSTPASMARRRFNSRYGTYIGALPSRSARPALRRSSLYARVAYGPAGAYLSTDPSGTSSFTPQRHRRVDAGCTAGGNPAGARGDEQDSSRRNSGHESKADIGEIIHLLEHRAKTGNAQRQAEQ